MLWNLALLWSSHSSHSVQSLLQTMKKAAFVTPCMLELTTKFWIFSSCISVPISLWSIRSTLSSIQGKKALFAPHEVFPLISTELHCISQFSGCETEKTEYCNSPSLDSLPVLLLCPLLFTFIQSWTIPVLSTYLHHVLIYAVLHLQMDVIYPPLFCFLVVWIPHRLSQASHDIILRD